METTIAVWPNYDWCNTDELEEYSSNKSDDYIVTTIITVDGEPSMQQLRAIVG